MARLRSNIRYALAAPCLAIIFAGLALRGADGSAPAALFAALLTLALIVVIAIWPRREVTDLLRREAVSIGAALLFVLLALASAVIFHGVDESSLWHPVWSAFDAEGRAISMAPYRTLEGVAAFFAPAAAFLLGGMTPTGRDARDQIGRWIMALSLGFAFLALYTFAVHGHFRERMLVFFVSPNTAATCFGVLAIFVGALLVRHARGRIRTEADTRVRKRRAGAMAALTRAPFAVSAFALLFTCLALTASRAGVPAAGIGFLVFAALLLIGHARLRQDKGRLVGLAPIVLLSGLALAFVFFGSHAMFERMEHLGGDFADRASMWDAHWRAFQDRMWLGHGLNTFRDINAHYAEASNWGALHVAGAAHNIFLQLLEETGVIGAALLVLAVAPPLWRTLKIAARGSGGSEWAAATFAAFALCFAHGLVDFGLQTPAIAALLAFCLGAYSRDTTAADSGARDQRSKSVPT